MITFIVCLALLISGYIFYGRRIEKRFAPDDRPTPSEKHCDGVDYVPMPLWKTFLIELLNIAGTGPVFGALSGAVFGPIVYIWIVLGCIFGGCVHDYMSGMISLRHNGASVSEITGIYLGNCAKTIMRVFSIVLLIMCGVVFTTGPAELLAMLTPEKLNASFWLWLVIVYYFAATFLPVDKIIGKIYPLFAVCLIIMAVGVGTSVLFSGQYRMPELWQSFHNNHPDGVSVWPFMFITVACGAISGFHATQSPMMARCIRSEREGRKVFCGAMAAEGVIALIWAAAGVSCYESSHALMEASASGFSTVVYSICTSTMGKIGGALALVGVIVCPISSGDTAYRSARLTLSDWFGLDQSDWKKRLFLTAPLLMVGAVVCKLDYSMVWRYFSWANQTLAMIVLWAASVYLTSVGRRAAITAIPATFMTAVSATYFIAAPECMGILWEHFGIGDAIYCPIAVAVGIPAAFAALFVFCRYGKKKRI